MGLNDRVFLVGCALTGYIQSMPGHLVEDEEIIDRSIRMADLTLDRLAKGSMDEGA